MINTDYKKLSLESVVRLLLTALLIAIFVTFSCNMSAARSSVKMKVARQSMSIYSDPSLSGNVLARRRMGECVEVYPVSNTAYCIVSGDTIVGYCSIYDLVDGNARFFAKVPHFWEEKDGQKKVSVLCDAMMLCEDFEVDLGIDPEETVLIQHDSFIKIASAHKALAQNGYSLKLVSAYISDGTKQNATGATFILRIDAKDDASDIDVNALLSEFGIVNDIGNSYYDTDIEKYMSVVITQDDITYIPAV